MRENIFEEIEQLSQKMSQLFNEIEQIKMQTDNLLYLNNSNEYKYANTLAEYVNILKVRMPNILIIISVKDTCGLSLNGERQKCFRYLGLNTNFTNVHGKGFIAVIDRGNVVFEKLTGTSGTLEYRENINGFPIYIQSSIYSKLNRSIIRIDDIGNYSVNERGFNFVIYDYEQLKVVDSVCFDTHVRGNYVRRNCDNIDSWRRDREIEEFKQILNKMQTKYDLQMYKQNLKIEGLMRKGEMDDLSARKKFFLTMPVAEGVLRLVQIANLKTLIHFDEVCKKNNIEYWLSYGALLGAVRHKGFIPWDDDIDVCVTRNQLSKIKKAFENDSNYVFISFIDKVGVNICYKIRYRQQGTSYDLDIFVYDYCSKFDDTVVRCQNELKLKLENDVRILRRKISDKQLLEMEERNIIEKYMQIANTELSMVENKYEANGLIWGVDNVRTEPGRRSSILIEDMFPLEEIKLENYFFSAPKNPEDYVKRLYGDIYSIPDDVFSHRHFDLNLINLETLKKITCGFEFRNEEI